ncbi:MAG: hypothetical protein GXO25_02570 [Euryarchaeota archaeon]|nr:hypothetical protein [Euryarchaeota archaeon]
MKDETFAQLNMFFIFIVANLLALILVPVYYSMYHNSLGEEGNNPWVAVYYILYIIGVTAVILYIAKLKKIGILKAIFYFAVAWTMLFALMPILYFIGIPYPGLISLAISVILTAILIKNPEWYMMNIVGILMAVGISLILGLSLGMVPIILLLSILAIYDAISVYKTKHMVSLADNVIQYNLPALFVVPSKSDFSYKKVKGIKKAKGKKKEREAYYMGFGDVMIPGILIISAATNFGLMAGVTTLIGAVLAMILLTAMVNSGNPQPGLPYLNGGALAGLLFFLVFFG